MKNNYVRISIGLILIAVVVTFLTTAFLTNPAGEPVKPKGKGFVVIELFTSEGCSSCPSADAAVEKIALLHPGDVYVLGFHVDYWNRLGWKDEFSDASYSERQRDYAKRFNLNSVYTPQVVVNGKDQFVGSDARQLTRSVDTETKNTINQPIELSALGSAAKTVQVTYKLQGPPNTAINIALVQAATQTNVKKGENEGRILHHINIVRDFKTISIPGNTGAVSLALPKGITAKDCSVIVYLQHLQTMEITAVATTTIN